MLIFSNKNAVQVSHTFYVVILCLMSGKQGLCEGTNVSFSHFMWPRIDALSIGVSEVQNLNSTMHGMDSTPASLNVRVYVNSSLPSNFSMGMGSEKEPFSTLESALEMINNFWMKAIQSFSSVDTIPKCSFFLYLAKAATYYSKAKNGLWCEAVDLDRIHIFVLPYGDKDLAPPVLLSNITVRRCNVEVTGVIVDNGYDLLWNVVEGRLKMSNMTISRSKFSLLSYDSSLKIDNCFLNNISCPTKSIVECLTSSENNFRNAVEMINVTFKNCSAMSILSAARAYFVSIFGMVLVNNDLGGTLHSNFPAVFLETSNLTFSHSTFAWNTVNGDLVYLKGALFGIDHNNFNNFSVAVSPFKLSEISFSRNSVAHGSLVSFVSCAIEFVKCNFTKNVISSDKGVIVRGMAEASSSFSKTLMSCNYVSSKPIISGCVPDTGTDVWYSSNCPSK